MIEEILAFEIPNRPYHFEPHGNGHIHETYKVSDGLGPTYILQKINTRVFKDPAAVMENIAAIIGHLRKKSPGRRETLSLIPTRDGKNWFLAPNGEAWRMFEFIEDSICMDQAQSLQDFRNSGVAFGRFQNLAADFPLEKLRITIPDFHNTRRYYEKLHDAVREDSFGRAKDVGRELDFVYERESYTCSPASDLPIRVTHNDTKLNNVLFDAKTREPLCVVDLDTVMPGLAIHDFGDAIRFGASTAVEDETDLSKIDLSLELFEAYTDGYLSMSRESLTERELDSLCDGAKTITLELSVRFLTDYLNGDVYFATHREKHNLDRCRAQLTLVSQMEKRWDDMQRIVQQQISK